MPDEELEQEETTEEQELEIVVEEQEEEAKPVTPAATGLTADDVKSVVTDALSALKPKEDEEDPDWSAEIENKAAQKALQAVQGLQRLQSEVEDQALSMLGDYADSDSIKYVRDQVRNADPNALAEALKNPRMIQGMIDTHLGSRMREGKLPAAKNVSTQVNRTTTGRNTVQMTKEQNQEFEEFRRGTLAGMPEDRKKAAEERWLVREGIKR